MIILAHSGWFCLRTVVFTFRFTERLAKLSVVRGVFARCIWERQTNDGFYGRCLGQR